MDPWSIAFNAASLLLLIFQGLLVWVLWSLRKQFVARSHCEAQCQAMTRRQTELEQAQKALPDADEVQALRVQLTEIEGSIKTVAATMQGQAEVMQRIERPLNLLLEHHLRGDK